VVPFAFYLVHLEHSEAERYQSLPAGLRLSVLVLQNDRVTYLSHGPDCEVVGIRWTEEDYHLSADVRLESEVGRTVCRLHITIAD
jgi:hypothetical protein